MVSAAALGLLLGFATTSAPAAAIPVSVYAEASQSYGFDLDDVDAAIDAGAIGPIEEDQFTGGIGWLTVRTPILIRNGFNGTDASNPSEADSTWTIFIDSDAPAAALQDFAFVILGHDPNDPSTAYETGNVGLEIDTELPWFFVTPTGYPSYVYIAYLLGDIETAPECETVLTGGWACRIDIHYLLAQPVELGTNETGETVLMFPRYAYAVASIPNVPEPSVLALLLVGVGAAFAAGRAR
jgi:hypothetical protein